MRILEDVYIFLFLRVSSSFSRTVSSHSASRGLMSVRVSSARRWSGDIGDVWNIPTQLLRRLLSLSLLFVRVLFFCAPTRAARNHLFGRRSRRRGEAFFRQIRREKIDRGFWVMGCRWRIFMDVSCHGNLILSRNDARTITPIRDDLSLFSLLDI